MLVIAHTQQTTYREIDTDAVCARAEHYIFRWRKETPAKQQQHNTSHEKNQENAAIYLEQSPKNISISSIILYKFLLLVYIDVV